MHECLTWGSLDGNNSILQWFGPELAEFEASCKRMMASFGAVLPEGSLKARIRCTTRESKNAAEGLLGDTLGDEAEGLVMVDFQGCVALGLLVFNVAHLNRADRAPTSLRSTLCSGSDRRNGQGSSSAGGAN